MAVRPPACRQLLALLDPLVAIQPTFEALKLMFEPLDVGRRPVGDLIEMPDTGSIHFVLQFLGHAPDQRELIAFAAARSAVERWPLAKLGRAGKDLEVAIA
jgi:hypothetical protein